MIFFSFLNLISEYFCKFYMKNRQKNVTCKIDESLAGEERNWKKRNFSCFLAARRNQKEKKNKTKACFLQHDCWPVPFTFFHLRLCQHMCISEVLTGVFHKCVCVCVNLNLKKKKKNLGFPFLHYEFEQSLTACRQRVSALNTEQYHYVTMYQNVEWCR